MTIALVQSANGQTSGLTVTATLGSTPSAGNLLVAFFANRNGLAATTISMNNSFGSHVQRRYTGATAGEWPVVLWYKFASGYESTSMTATTTTSNNIVICVAEFSGVGSFDASSGADSFTTAATATFSPASGKEILLVSGCIARTDTTPQNFAPGGSMTELFEAGGRPPSAFNYQIIANSSGSYTVGSTGASTSRKGLWYASFIGSPANVAAFYATVIA